VALAMGPNDEEEQCHLSS